VTAWPGQGYISADWHRRNTAVTSSLSRRMQQINPTVALSQFVGSLPTFIAVISGMVAIEREDQRYKCSL
jgi:hypothetical protein